MNPGETVMKSFLSCIIGSVCLILCPTEFMSYYHWFSLDECHAVLGKPTNIWKCYGEHYTDDVCCDIPDADTRPIAEPLQQAPTMMTMREQETSNAYTRGLSVLQESINAIGNALGKLTHKMETLVPSAPGQQCAPHQ